jgi:predicted amidophosphoribosyltransferase
MNPQGVRFCTLCHETLLFKCPVCWHVQKHGGSCEKCGANFAAYAGFCLAQTAREEQQAAIDRFKGEVSLLSQILLVPLVGGRWLLRLIFGRLVSRLIAR